MQGQRGFTLIELVVVIVILGILAATALPRFIDLSTDARNSAAQGVAGSIASATSMNYAARMAGNLGIASLSGASVCSAASLQPFVTGVSLVASAPASPTAHDFLIGGSGNCTAAGNAVTCTVTAAAGSGNTAQNATVICSN